MFLWHIYHLFPSKYWHHSNIVSSHIYHSFPSKILASFECSSVIYLPFISLKSTDIIRIWFRPIFTINFLKNSWTISIWFCHLFMTYFLQKYWRHSNMVLTHIYHLLPTKMLESFGYGYVTYLLFICFENTGIIWICFCYIFIINLLRNIGIVWIWFCCMLFS